MLAVSIGIEIWKVGTGVSMAGAGLCIVGSLISMMLSGISIVGSEISPVGVAIPVMDSSWFSPVITGSIVARKLSKSKGTVLGVAGGGKE